jgi:hypothetical protein
MLTGKIRDDLDVSVEEFERLLSQEGQWVKYETIKLIKIIALAVFVVLAIVLTVLAYWKFDFNFFLAVFSAVLFAFSVTYAITMSLTFFLSRRYAKQTKSRMQAFKERKVNELKPSSKSLKQSTHDFVVTLAKALRTEERGTIGMEGLRAALETLEDEGIKTLAPATRALRANPEITLPELLATLKSD